MRIASRCLPWLALQALFAVPLGAKPEYLQYWQTRYPASTLPERVGRATGSSCRLCHPRTGFSWDDPGNAYREMIHAYMHGGKPGIQAAIDAAGALDSDGDGVPSSVEILTPRPGGEVGYHPGLVGERGIDPTSATRDEVVTGQPETPPASRSFVFDPPALDFGSVALGQRVLLELKVRNASPVRQTLVGLRFALVNSSVFSFDAPHRYPLPLEPGEAASCTVEYVGSNPGYFYRSLAWLEAVSADPGQPVSTVLLSGLGGFGPFSLSASMVHFDVIEVGASARRSILLTNTGGTPLTVGEPRIEGQGADAFRLRWSGAPSVTLEPRTMTILEVTFEPAGERKAEAYLRLDTDAPAQPEIAIHLSGEGRRRVTPGDANRDGELDVSDAVKVLIALFVAADAACPEALDADEDGRILVSDAVHLLRVLFLGTPGPTACALDPSPRYLGCPEGSPCDV
ncbi:MAG: choice-of-anchor D domain-containing protein [Planctomycetes bacterium]|nr:choice-of-anchor D domain-containing protein [Planctomycetota bacterium]